LRRSERIRARRSKDQIILEILRICARGENVTKIVYQTNTNFTTVKGYLNLLMKNGLIECEVASPRLYRSTSKGLETMNRLKELHRELEQLTV
jgi:predicted transcriptional regulator